MSDLLSFITEMPTEEDSHNRAHKWPFVVSDILSQENSSLLDVFFRDEEEEEEEEEVQKDADEASPVEDEEAEPSEDNTEVVLPEEKSGEPEDDS